MKMELAALGGTVASGSTLAHIDPAMETDETHYFSEAPALPCGHEVRTPQHRETRSQLHRSGGDIKGGTPSASHDTAPRVVQHPVLIQSSHKICLRTTAAPDSHFLRRIAPHRTLSLDSARESELAFPVAPVSVCVGLWVHSSLCLRILGKGGSRMSTSKKRRRVAGSLQVTIFSHTT